MSKYRIARTSRFKKDLKAVIKRGYNINLMGSVVDMLADGQELPVQYRDHELTGNFKGCRECHITPDWLLIYEVADEELILYLTRTGSHSDLF